MQGTAELTKFIRREHPRLVGALTVHCGDRALAEDLAQEALARICDRWTQVSAMEQPTAWLYRTAMNLSSSWFRRRAAELRAHARHGGANEDSGGDTADATADAISVRAAVRGLPTKQRTALVYRYYLDLSVAETAALMHTSEAAVRQMTSRAVGALRPRFGATIRNEGLNAK